MANNTDKSIISSPLEHAFGALLLRAHPPDLEDCRNAESISPATALKLGMLAPLVGRLEAYGAFPGGAPSWTRKPGIGGRYHAGTGQGGVAFQAPDWGIENSLTNTAPNSAQPTPHFTFWNSRLGFGQPSETFGLTITGFTFRQNSAQGNNQLIVDYVNSSGVSSSVPLLLDGVASTASSFGSRIVTVAGATTANQVPLYDGAGGFSWGTSSGSAGSGGFFGDGSDGAFDFDGVTVYGRVAGPGGSVYTLNTGDLNATTIRVRSGVTLNTNGFRIRATTSVTVDAGGTIDFSGLTASAFTGAGALFGFTLGTGTLIGTAGGNGGSNSVGLPGTNGTTTSNLGGRGGSGGSGGATAGGSAGTVGTPRTGSYQCAVIASTGILLTAESIYSGMTTGGIAGAAQFTIQGGSGGGGGGSSLGSGHGGGGGSGGGVISICAKLISVAGTISANGGGGGNGGNGASSAQGGGGGGGGGAILLVYSTLTNTGSISVAGGAGGVATVGSVNGSAGSAGTVVSIQV